MRKVQRVVKLLFVVFFMMLFVQCPVFAAEQTETIPENVDLYFLDYECDKTIPDTFRQSYQIPLSGDMNATFSVVSGNSATVSATGLIEPKVKYTYWNGNIGFSSSTGAEDEVVTKSYYKGTTTISATVNHVTTIITVNVLDYAVVYSDNVVAEAAAKIAAEHTTQADQFKAAVAYTAQNYDYSASYSGYIGIIMCGGGDCWASTSLILELCEKLEIQAYVRNAVADPYAGSGHRNVVALCDGVIYIGDAGYTGKKPRSYEFFAEEDGFSKSGTTAYQYDGFDAEVMVPEGVTVLGNGKRGVFPYSYQDVTKVTLSSTVSTVNTFAFGGCYSLTEINVSEENPYFTSVDGVLYSKDMTRIVAYPPGKKLDTYTIPDTVTTIGKTCFYYVTCVDRVELPDTITWIEEGAFFSSEIEVLRLPESVEQIDSNTFYSVGQLFVESANVKLGASLCSTGTVIYCLAGSTIAEYAKNNSLLYIIYTLEEMRDTNIDLTDAVVTNMEQSYVYTDGGVKPEPVVTLNGKVLAAGTEYQLSYSGYNSEGTATMTIKGIGRYTGTITLTYEIVKTQVVNPQIICTATTSCTTSNYRSWVKDYITILYEGKELVYGTDYEVNGYRYSPDTGEIWSVIIKYKGIYTGTLEIKPKEVINSTQEATTEIPETEDKTEEKTETPGASDRSEEKTEVSETEEKTEVPSTENKTEASTEIPETDGFGNTTEPNGSGSNVTTEKGNNNGNKNQMVVKKPKVSKVKKLKVKAASTYLKITWKKSSGTNGYQLQISTKKNFKGAKKISVSKKKTGYTKKNLKKNKKYYIRIRAYKKYKTSDGSVSKVYGKWVMISKKTKK